MRHDGLSASVLLSCEEVDELVRELLGVETCASDLLAFLDQPATGHDHASHEAWCNRLDELGDALRNALSARRRRST